MRISLVLALLWLAIPANAQIVLSGYIRDAESEAALNAAHVVVVGSNQGTITNSEGAYDLIVQDLPVTLRVRYIGYQTKDVLVKAEDDRAITILLDPVIYRLGELFVAGEDVAENIMRKVISRKAETRQHLRTYDARGFNRITLENNGDIKLISESVFDIYWDQKRGTREVVRSRRETADFYKRLVLNPHGHIQNLYDDFIEVQGVRFIGPTHPDALDYYTFSFARGRGMDDDTVYDIYVAPKTGLDNTFIGHISILDEAYTLVEANLRPARHVVFPEPIKSWPLFYRQQFSVIDSTHWMPVDLRLDGLVHVDPGDQGYAPIKLSQISRITDYRLNSTLPEEYFAQPDRVLIDEESVFKDDLFLLGRNIVPLTPRETVALARLERSGMTLEQAFPPEGQSGAFAAFMSRRNDIDGPQFIWPEILGYEPWLRFNRVDGYFFGIGKTLNFSPGLATEFRAGQTSGLKKVRFKGRAFYRWGRGGTFEGGYLRDTEARNKSLQYPLALASLPPLLGIGDYFDYYWHERIDAKVSYAFPLIRFSAGFYTEKQESAERHLKRSWPFSLEFPENPKIQDGRMNTITASVAIGDSYLPIRTTANRRAEVRLEHSDPSLGSDFSFTRLTYLFDSRLKTFFRSRVDPNHLDVRVIGGHSWGSLPVQRLGVLDGTLGPFATLGSFKSLGTRPYEGERMLGVFWEHDFQTTLFELFRITEFVERKMGIRIFGAHGRTWLEEERIPQLSFTPTYQDQYHHEVGLSITNIWGSNFRIDVTRRLDHPGWFVGFGVSRLK